MIKKLAIDKNIPVGLIDPGTIDNTRLGKRMLSLICEIPLCRIMNGFFRKSDLQKINETGEKLYDAPIFTITEPNMNFEYFRHNAGKMLKQKPIRLLVIEGFEYFAECVDSNKNEYRYNLGFLKDFGKNLVVPYKADMVLLIHRDENDGVKYIVVKNVNEECYKVRLRFDPNIGLFEGFHEDD